MSLRAGRLLFRRALNVVLNDAFIIKKTSRSLMNRAKMRHSFEASLRRSPN